MKKIILILAIFGVILLSGCTTGPVCNKPYILVGNDCCLDKDLNKICDKDESTGILVVTKEQKAEEPKTETAPVVVTPTKSNALIADNIAGYNFWQYFGNGQKIMNFLIVYHETDTNMGYFAGQLGKDMATYCGINANMGYDKADIEIVSAFSQNLILLGNVCDNMITQELLGNPTQCDSGFSDGTSYLKQISKNGMNYIIATDDKAYNELKNRLLTKANGCDSLAGITTS